MPPASQKPILADRIVNASIAIAVAHIAFKLAGLLQVMVFARYLDSTTYDVVWAFAFENCIFAIFLIGENLIGPSFLPVFMRELDTNSEGAAWDFANALFTIQLIVLLATVAVLILFPDMVIGVITAWDSVSHPEEFALARTSLIWVAPSVIFLSLGSTTYMMLNGYKRFFLAAFGDASWKFCVLLFVLIGMGFLGFGIESLLFGLLFGSMAKLGTHLIGMLRELPRFRFSLRLNSAPMRAMLVLLLPLVAGILIAKVRDVFNNVTILSHLEASGLLQANSIGRKIFVTLGWLVPYTISIAAFPFFCELVDRNDHKELGNVLTHSGRMLLAVFIPFSLVCIVLAEPITSLLFYGGEFTLQSVRWTAVSMACYTLVLPAYAIEYLLMQAYFANRRMVLVTAIGAIFSFGSIAVSYVGIALLGATPVWALGIVAIGFTLSRTLKVVALVVFLRRQVPIFPLGPTLALVGKALLTGAVCAGLCFAANWAFLSFISDRPDKLLVLARLTAGGMAAAAGFLVSLFLFRMKEPIDMLEWGMQRFKRRLSADSVR